MSQDNDVALSDVNRVLRTINALPRRSNPGAVSAPVMTGCFSIFDLNKPMYHCVFLHKLESNTVTTSDTDNVVVFSEHDYAPERTKSLQLATPRYYRSQEALKPGIGDPKDGTLTKDGSYWLSSTIGGSVHARLTFSSNSEPWVYCASHYRSDEELRNLIREFGSKYEYSVATKIIDPDAFALWLGVDFTLGFDKTADVSLSLQEELVYRTSRCAVSSWTESRPIDTVVHVYYGPVIYADISGRVDKQDHLFDPLAGPQTWFTKKTALSSQREYRFAVSTLGTPVRQKHYISVSPELRATTLTV
ncbi:MAG: hypothetical protein OXG25_10160 [Gammaproteobacteria bacterium]|nr:hypothetical protein [Gammaproteobacteria bacterium]